MSGVSPAGLVFEISVQQKYTWLIDEQGPPNACGRFTITGPLHADALQAAIAQVVERHEILRSTFLRIPGLKLPRQSIAADVRWIWQITDLTTTEAQAPALQRLFEEARRRPFDLEHGPTVRAELVRLDQQRHALILCMICPSHCSMPTTPDGRHRC
jgi:hypothetical protein